MSNTSDHAQRWYGGRSWAKAEKGRVQDARDLAEGIPLDILRLAHAEYARHHQQTFERLQERGGFSVSEVIMLLADAAASGETPT